MLKTVIVLEINKMDKEVFISRILIFNLKERPYFPRPKEDYIPYKTALKIFDLKFRR